MRALPCGFAFILLLAACGGGASTGSEPKTVLEQAEGSDSPSEGHESAGEGEAKDDGAKAELARGPSCDDGTCSSCGNGICPAGWYCDEKAGGGGACSWLTECADKATCACVTRVLGAACKCREEGGGLKVACD